MEEMVAVEQTLYAIMQSIRFGENVAALCERWWTVSAKDHTSIIEVLRHDDAKT